MSEYTRNIQRMEERVRETEIRAALSAKQVSYDYWLVDTE